VRIIGGTYKGRIIHAPQLKETRPTTDYAKEGLFNVLQHNYNLEGITVLDLFCGTGSLSLEFVSRGALKITSVDHSFKAIQNLKKIYTDWDIKNAHTIKQDAISFLKSCNEKYDIIIADPPLTFKNSAEIPEIVFQRQLLNNGLLIIEHPAELVLKNCSNFIETRHYGKVNFSFFKS
jgi:16S rRNA (guanine(966)-N(2))-methyltransferase RsmD